MIPNTLHTGMENSTYIVLVQKLRSVISPVSFIVNTSAYLGQIDVAINLFNKI